MSISGQRSVKFFKKNGLHNEIGYSFIGERENKSLDKENTEIQLILQGIEACSKHSDWNKNLTLCATEMSSSKAKYDVVLSKPVFEYDPENENNPRLQSSQFCLRQLFGTSLDSACSFPLICGNVSLYQKQEQ